MYKWVFFSEHNVVQEQCRARLKLYNNLFSPTVRAYATVLRLSVTYVLWLNGAS